MIYNFVIIGGGVAGLSAAIRLTELGAKPLVLEGGHYPYHKVCGEFLSPECLSYLHQWDIQPVPIYQMHLRTISAELTFPFRIHAGALSHLDLDPSLAKHATAHGATISLDTQVKAFHPKSSFEKTHRIELMSGEMIHTYHAIIATGRIPGYHQKKPISQYIGIKSHFAGIPINHALEMFSFPGAYLGIVPVGPDTYNVACLATMKNVKKQGGVEAFMEDLISQNSVLKSYLLEGKNLFSQWMSVPISSFGLKQTPAWEDIYFIGDAAMTVPPACGGGLSLAINGGCLAAEYAIHQHAKDFKSIWRAKCTNQLFWAKVLHQMMMCPQLGNKLIKCAHIFPSLANYTFHLTRISSD